MFDEERAFNRGYFIAIKRSLTGGGALHLEHIDGSVSGGPPQRGLQPRGTSVGVGSLEIYPHFNLTTALRYPLDCKFEANGVAIIEFLYDFAVIPLTVGHPSGIQATRCRYRVGAVPGHNNISTIGHLLHFSNVGAFEAASPHFANPSLPIPIPRIDEAIEEAATMARRLYAAINSLSRHTMAGVAII